MQPCPKPEPRSKERARARRHEAEVIKRVRAEVADRDGYCRAAAHGITACAGVSEWAHMTEKRRARTMGQPPEVRHTPEHSLMLCERHHDDYDESRIVIVPLNPEMGAQGFLAFGYRASKMVHVEAADRCLKFPLSAARAVAALLPDLEECVA